MNEAPDIVRAAYVDLVVTDLARARAWWVDLIGFHVEHEEVDALYLRGYEEFVHHSVSGLMGERETLPVSRRGRVQHEDGPMAGEPIAQGIQAATAQLPGHDDHPNRLQRFQTTQGSHRSIDQIK